MVIFHSYVSSPEGNWVIISYNELSEVSDKPAANQLLPGIYTQIPLSKNLQESFLYSQGKTPQTRSKSRRLQPNPDWFGCSCTSSLNPRLLDVCRARPYALPGADDGPFGEINGKSLRNPKGIPLLHKSENLNGCPRSESHPRASQT